MSNTLFLGRLPLGPAPQSPSPLFPLPLRHLGRAAQLARAQAQPHPAARAPLPPPLADGWAPPVRATPNLLSETDGESANAPASAPARVGYFKCKQKNPQAHGSPRSRRHSPTGGPHPSGPPLTSRPKRMGSPPPPRLPRPRVLGILNANRKIRKRTDTDVAFTREYSRVSIIHRERECTY